VDRPLGQAEGIERGNCIGPVILDQGRQAGECRLVTRPCAIEQSHR
jgi:hypothetical protein